MITQQIDVPKPDGILLDPASDADCRTLTNSIHSHHLRSTSQMHVDPVVARFERRQQQVDFQPFARIQGTHRNKVNPFAANVFRGALYYLFSS
jgi:hypothetical protein